MGKRDNNERGVSHESAQRSVETKQACVCRGLRRTVSAAMHMALCLRWHCVGVGGNQSTQWEQRLCWALVRRLVGTEFFLGQTYCPRLSAKWMPSLTDTGRTFCPFVAVNIRTSCPSHSVKQTCSNRRVRVSISLICVSDGPRSSAVMYLAPELEFPGLNPEGTGERPGLNLEIPVPNRTARRTRRMVCGTCRTWGPPRT